MLLQLTINNFALIEKASLDFKEGFTILSGETGAGKSILIDAINYVQGSKFNKDLIRTGEEKTFVEAIFSIDDNERLKEILDDLEIEYDDTLIQISNSNQRLQQKTASFYIISKNSML